MLWRGERKSRKVGARSAASLFHVAEAAAPAVEPAGACGANPAASPNEAHSARRAFRTLGISDACGGSFCRAPSGAHAARLGISLALAGLGGLSPSDARSARWTIDGASGESL